ncbi:sigma-70 family RNA polymerase sigma factor [Prosthecobacter sp.]|uniref:RNA polymerase sigma factor n=1 Tax=Prosthecobacter sp. TaxID=1965333 RepID=UPI002AB93651|nr:sigma-70 family RNA polymerase sigma factor [Prosthecobacter sp.]MDZ4403984.1 sigma-70 family RNA polymerase sigma factor [Prosthecobacter sp.]
MKTFHTYPVSLSNTALSQDKQPLDEDLMCAIQMHDPVAMDTLFQRYRMLLKSVILRIVPDAAAADDVLQECILEIWNHADHFSAAKGRPLGWIVTLARRRAIDHLRRSQAYNNAKDRLEDETKLRPLTQNAAADCEQADICRVLRQHLSRLPAHQQQVIHLAFLKGMSQREVAQATHTPLGTVKTRLELGLKKLRSSFRTRNVIHSLQYA